MNRARRLLLAAALCSMGAAGAGQAPQGVGLVLGGGGARGAAHIGVLKVLERERIPVSHIAGTSMGAIVGGLYAAGYSPEEIESILVSVDWRDIFNDSSARIDQPMRRKQDDLRFLLDYQLGFGDGHIRFPSGAVQGQKLLLLMRRLLVSTWNVQDFDTLPIPFRCVSTDLGSGEAVIYRSGDLALAIRASISVPAVFAPIQVEGKLLVDGGLVNNLPVDVARELGPQPLVAVDVSEPMQPGAALQSPVAITAQMFSVLIRQQTRSRLALRRDGDVWLVPEIPDFGNADFVRVREAIPAGARSAEDSLAELRRHSVSEAEYAAWRARHRRREFDPPLLAFLRVIKRDSRTARYVENRLEKNVNEPLDIGQVEQDISRAYGAGTYEQIGWRLVEQDGHSGLEVRPVDKSWGPNFLTFGLQLSDNFEGRNSYQLVVESTQTGLNSRGGEWRNRLSLGEVTGARTELYQPWGHIGQYYVLPYLDAFAADQSLTLGGAGSGEYRLKRYETGLELGWDPNPLQRLSLALSRGKDDARLEFGSAPDQLRSDYSALTLGLIHDSLDDASFPSQGSRAELEISAYRDMLGGETEGEVASLAWNLAGSLAPHHWLLGARLHTSQGDLGPFQEGRFLGGFTNLSGFGENELFGRHSGLVNAIYYRRLGDASRLLSVPFYVGGSLEAGNVWQDRDDISTDSLIYAGSLFLGVDTIFGPVFFGYGHSDGGHGSLYLNFGSLLRPEL